MSSLNLLNEDSITKIAEYSFVEYTLRLIISSLKFNGSASLLVKHSLRYSSLVDLLSYSHLTLKYRAQESIALAVRVDFVGYCIF